jgi:hypothetical protein
MTSTATSTFTLTVDPLASTVSEYDFGSYQFETLSSYEDVEDDATDDSSDQLKIPKSGIVYFLTLG